jgi:ankyrin repeat protein
MLAAQVGAEEIAKILLDAGCDPNLSDNEKLTALHYASENGHTKLCELMLARNAAADCKDHAGNMRMFKKSLHYYFPSFTNLFVSCSCTQGRIEGPSHRTC